MIRKDPVYKSRDTRLWLDPNSGFETGMVDLVVKNLGVKPIPAWMDRSHLIRVKEEKGKEKERIAKILAGLAHHADLAICLIASEVQMMDMRRMEHPCLDLPIVQTMDQVDVVVILELQEMTPASEPFIDLLVARRARPPARVTILSLPEKNAPKFRSSIRMFGKRRVDIWK